MRIRLAVPDRYCDAGVIGAALEAVTRANEAMIADGAAPTSDELLRRGARWAPEPFTDGEHFDLASTIAKRGVGDCDDWAPAHAATLRASGVDPGARAIVRATRPGRWHAVVLRSDGSIEDPSRDAGMGRNRSSVAGAVCAPMSQAGRAAIACLPHAGRWWARADLPWEGNRTHVVGVASDADPRRALTDAVRGACVVGVSSGVVGDDYAAMASAVHDAVRDGANARDLARELRGRGVVAGDDVLAGLEDAASVGFLGSLAAPLASAAGGALKGGLGALGFGGGGAGAPAGGGAAPGGGSGAPIVTQGTPGGPIIVRF